MCGIKQMATLFIFVILTNIMYGCVSERRATIIVPQPILSNPVYADGNETVKCAIDDTGLHCWGKFIAEEDVGVAWEESGLNKIDVPIVNPISFDLYKITLCVVGEFEAYCQDVNSFINDAVHQGRPPYYSRAPQHIALDRFTNPSSVRVGSIDIVCAISDLGVECERNQIVHFLLPSISLPIPTSTPFSVPKFINPTSLSVGQHHACAIDTNGVQCWAFGNTYLRPEENAALASALDVPIDLVNPTQIAVGYLSTCVIDDVNVRCWGEPDYIGPMPTFNAPTQLVWAGSAPLNQYCALDGATLSCWVTHLNPAPSKTLINPISITGGNSSLCTVDNNGVQC